MHGELILFFSPIRYEKRDPFLNPLVFSLELKSEFIDICDRNSALAMNMKQFRGKVEWAERLTQVLKIARQSVFIIFLHETLQSEQERLFLHSPASVSFSPQWTRQRVIL